MTGYQDISPCTCARWHAPWNAYRQVSNIRRTLVSNKVVDHSDVVGASPSNYIFILHLTLGLNILRKDSCKPRRETYKFWDLVCLILDVLRYFNFSDTALSTDNRCAAHPVRTPTHIRMLCYRVRSPYHIKSDTGAVTSYTRLPNSIHNTILQVSYM